jgi:hypothetical protein
MSSLTPLALVTFCLVFPSTTAAQLSAHAAFTFSTDNGATWQPDSLTVPASQTSVLVRLNVTILDGTQALPGRSVHFSSANLESYVTTAVATGDTMLNPLVHEVSSPGNPFLRPGPFAGRRVGNILALDRRNDTTPLGNNPAVFVVNEPTGFEGPRTFNPLTMLQYELSLDGTVGERSLSSVFLPIFTPAISVGSNQVGVFDYRGTSLVVRAVEITQTPATLVVVPAPSSAAVLASIALFTSRRRRI